MRPPGLGIGLGLVIGGIGLATPYGRRPAPPARPRRGARNVPEGGRGVSPPAGAGTLPDVPTSPLPAELRELLAKPNAAVIATVRADGQPVTVATWYVLDGDRVLVNMDAGRTRLDHLRNDPRVSLTVLDSASWYTHVSLQGGVTELVDDEGLADIDRISRHYTGDAYPQRDRGRVSAWIEIDRWHGWGAARDAG